MIDIRQFIRNLGEDAPSFFNTTQKSVDRWLKTGNIPVKAAQKVFAAAAALKGDQPAPAPTVSVRPQEEDIDPMTNLPRNITSRLPNIQFAGRPPEIIEISPVEQSFGNNLTRPGRVARSPQTLPPMKIRRTSDGQTEVYVDNNPKTPAVFPPEMGGEGWTKPHEPTTEKA